MNPFQEFQNWLFDGKEKSKVSDNLIKTNSPISQLFAIKMFRNNGKLNHYLNQYLNTYDIFQIEKEELFYFLKKCVIDYKVSRRSIPYFKGNKKDKEFKVLRQKFPLLKNDDINLLSELIQKSNNKNDMMIKLGLSKDYKKIKSKKSKNKKMNKVESNSVRKGITLNEFLTKNFICFEIEK